MIDLTNIQAQSIASASSDERLATLERIVLDLMMEIEALRACVMELSSSAVRPEENSDALAPSPGGVDGDHSPYGKAYMQTAWLTHWAAGPTSGFDKLLKHFYGRSSTSKGAHPGQYRELLMLQRLGYSEAQIAQYVQNADAAETCT